MVQHSERKAVIGPLVSVFTYSHYSQSPQIAAHLVCRRLTIAVGFTLVTLFFDITLQLDHDAIFQACRNLQPERLPVLNTRREENVAGLMWRKVRNGLLTDQNPVYYWSSVSASICFEMMAKSAQLHSSSVKRCDYLVCSASQ
jgi:hypothetical protein